MPKAGKSALPSAVRIIAGRLKGRRIPIESETIRPTPDRVRETVFNWLAAHLDAVHCLDMFAGSGALGIEAWSRGADSVIFVEQDKQAVEQLGSRLAEFGCAGEVHQADALRLDYSVLGPFDIVFLDPPFKGPDMVNLCTLLESSGGLSASALIYMEMDRCNEVPELPPNWSLIKEKTAGQVRFALAERSIRADG